MFPRRIWIAVSMIGAGAILTLIVSLISFSISDWRLWAFVASAGCGVAGLVLAWPRRSEEDPQVAALRLMLAERDAKSLELSEVFEKSRAMLLENLDVRTNRLDERECDLVSRFARFHEFLEYPIEDVHAERESGELQKLTEQDRQVRQLLDTEAERVYEKIRRNGYTVEGRVDALAIRDEALGLIKQVAKIYKPGCEFPLLETSFEQLARAASRICLHTLVLLEQLPVNVQRYNINTLYGYFRKAVVGYGVYQKATPWLSYLSRGIYAGRMVATTNPATLGAWWLATELGKRGAQKVVENVVDRQAIAVLHDLVTIIGVEAAGIYGTGFRQRDAAWMLGTELVELIHAFPASAECLKYGLQQVTALPLKSEYDRIYLYRCLADHRSAGLHLADSAMLSRDEREAIARHLEKFFVEHIHGANDSNVKRWREGFENRFDLRLKLDRIDKHLSSSKEQQLALAMSSLIAFLRHVMTADEAAVSSIIKTFRTFAMLTETQKQTAMSGTASSRETRFEPPELDPQSEIISTFLTDLASCTAISDLPDEHAEKLVAETWSYFRRTAKEAEASIGNAWKQKLRWQCVEPSLADEISPAAARAFFGHRRSSEKLVFAYGSLSSRSGSLIHPLSEHWLFGCDDLASGIRRVFVASEKNSESIVWNAAMPLTLERVPGILLDDAAITKGSWLVQQNALGFDRYVGDLLISGSLRGGRYRSYFRPLIEFSNATEK